MSLIFGSAKTALCRRGNGTLNMVNQTRNGGGGGRPGGAIVFNWKEKKLLRLSLKKNKRENIRIPPIGHLEDILHLFDESKGDRIIDEPTFRVEALPRVIEIENFRRQVDVSMLYGSGKSSGLIEKKRNVGKLKFSHLRVFGNKEISKSVQ